MQRARELLAEAAARYNSIPRALAVVQLEGPEHVAERAERVATWAGVVRTFARSRTNSTNWVRDERDATRSRRQSTLTGWPPATTSTAVKAGVGIEL